jgi:hypothetical protein
MMRPLRQYGGVLPPVRSDYFGRTWQKEMLAMRRRRLLPDGILEGRNMSEDLLAARPLGDPEIVRMALPGVDWSRDARWFGFSCGPPCRESECLGLIVTRYNQPAHPASGRTVLHDVAGLGLKIPPGTTKP